MTFVLDFVPGIQNKELYVVFVRLWLFLGV